MRSVFEKPIGLMARKQVRKATRFVLSLRWIHPEYVTGHSINVLPPLKY